MQSDDRDLDSMSPGLRELARQERLYFRPSSWRLEYVASHYDGVLNETKRIHFLTESSQETVQKFDPIFLMAYTILNYTGEDEDNPAPLGRIIPLHDNGLEIDIPLTESDFDSLLDSLQRTVNSHHVVIKVISPCGLSELESGYAPVIERTIMFSPKTE